MASGAQESSLCGCAVASGVERVSLVQEIEGGRRLTGRAGRGASGDRAESLTAGFRRVCGARIGYRGDCPFSLPSPQFPRLRQTLLHPTRTPGKRENPRQRQPPRVLGVSGEKYIVLGNSRWKDLTWAVAASSSSLSSTSSPSYTVRSERSRAVVPSTHTHPPSPRPRDDQSNHGFREDQEHHVAR